MTPELEIILAEGAGLQPGLYCSKISQKRNRCRLGQISLIGMYGGCCWRSRGQKPAGGGKFPPLFLLSFSERELTL